MILGFTGTSKGMTQRQRATVRYLFRELQLTVGHFGDCVGADHEAFVDARNMGARTVGHPPTDPKKRALCPFDEERQPKPYLVRDREIVQEGVDGLVAAPRQMTEPASKRGEGTWTTIGYARQAGRRIWIVRPDGTFTVENDAWSAFDTESSFDDNFYEPDGH